MNSTALHLGTGASALLILNSAFAFQGRISAALTRSAETQTSFYIVGTNQLLIERAETNRPYAKNIIALDTGDITLVFPHNRSFVRLRQGVADVRSDFENPGQPGSSPHFPVMAPGAEPQPQRWTVPAAPASIGPTNLPGAPQMPPMPRMPSVRGAVVAGGMPAMPMMMPPMAAKLELRSTGQKTNLLGFACEKFELKQRGEVMEIWATDKLFSFHPYVHSQPHRVGTGTIEEQWGGLLKDKKLFPLLAVLRFEHALPSADGGSPGGRPERLRFEVTSITRERINDPEGKLFQPPANYVEVQPLPF